MITLPDALTADHVVLDLAVATPEAAVAAVAGLLRNDPRVVDWEEFAKVLHAHPACRVADEAGVGLCIPHARTAAVDEIVISAARLSPELVFEGFPSAVRYLFCIGVPQTMAADYLRIVGALLRLVKDPETEAALHAAPSRQAFVDALGRFELKLS